MSVFVKEMGVMIVAVMLAVLIYMNMGDIV